MINLISDTVTRPSAAMLDAMLKAAVGDDVFKADPSVNALQEYAAQLFGHEAALFCPSGTMTNQIAIKCHTQPMDELICDYTSHVYQYENGGYSFHSGVAVQLLHGEGGKLTPEMIQSANRPNYDWLPNSRLVVLENSVNKAGGNTYSLKEAQDIRSTTNDLDLSLHLDGARLFNVLVESNESTEDWGKTFDSISICLSKGLGAPVGSLLIGNSDFIAKARKWRKAMGGGMRQAGYLAAAGLFALKNNIPQLKVDNDRARIFGEKLNSLPWVASVLPVKTNILIFDVNDPLNAQIVLTELEKNGILASAFGPQSIRFVTHLDLSEDDVRTTLQILQELSFNQ